MQADRALYRGAVADLLKQSGTKLIIAEALRLIRPSTAVPIHWGTYRPMFSAPPGEEAALAFVHEAAELAPDVAVRVLHPGEALTV